MRLTSSHRMTKTLNVKRKNVATINGGNFGENFHVSSLKANGFNISPSCIQAWTLKILIDLFFESLTEKSSKTDP